MALIQKSINPSSTYYPSVNTELNGRKYYSSNNKSHLLHSTAYQSSTTSLAAFASDIETEITRKVLSELELKQINPQSTLMVTMFKIVDEVVGNINNNLTNTINNKLNGIASIVKQHKEIKLLCQTNKENIKQLQKQSNNIVASKHEQQQLNKINDKKFDLILKQSKESKSNDSKNKNIQNMFSNLNSKLQSLEVSITKKMDNKMDELNKYNKSTQNIIKQMKKVEKQLNENSKATIEIQTGIMTHSIAMQSMRLKLDGVINMNPCNASKSNPLSNNKTQSKNDVTLRIKKKKTNENKLLNKKIDISKDKTIKTNTNNTISPPITPIPTSYTAPTSSTAPLNETQILIQHSAAKHIQNNTKTNGVSSTQIHRPQIATQTTQKQSPIISVPTPTTFKTISIDTSSIPASQSTNITQTPSSSIITLGDRMSSEFFPNHTIPKPTLLPTKLNVRSFHENVINNIELFEDRFHAGSLGINLQKIARNPLNPIVSSSAKDLALQSKKTGNICYKNKQFETAITHYQQAQKLDCLNAVYILNESAALFMLKRWSQTIVCCRSALQLIDDFQPELLFKVYKRLGSVEERIDNIPAAFGSYAKALECVHDHELETKLNHFYELLEAKKHDMTHYDVIINNILLNPP